MTTKERKQAKDHRWTLRVAEDEDALVRWAAQSCDLGHTAFIRQAAFIEAQRVLADRRSFALDQDAWRQFSALLDRPPKVPAGLERLFSRPSVFED